MRARWLAARDNRTVYLVFDMRAQKVLTLRRKGPGWKRLGEMALPSGVHMAGLWEFPGGKVEEGESFSEALARELDEELGIVVEIGGPLTFAVHTEPDLEILLLFFSGVIATGVPTPREGQELRWVRPDELRDFPMPPADDEVVELLTAQPLAIINRHDADREPRAPTAKPGAP